MITTMKKLRFESLRILHLPKLYTNQISDNFIKSIPDCCPNLREIGFRIDDQVTCLPID